MDVGTANLKKILTTDSTYIIPSYQRPYSWTEIQWSGLIEDLCKLHESRDENGDFIPVSKLQHFFGAVVLYHHSDDSSTQSIVDGQQRITTLFILSAALLNAAKRIRRNPAFSDDHSVDNKIKGRLSGVMVVDENYRSDTGSLQEALRLSPLEVDKASFTSVVASSLTDNPDWRNIDTDDNVHQIEYAYRYFSDSLEEYFVEFIKAGYLEREDCLLRAADLVKESFKFATITVSKEEKPQEIFESLNARSVPLQGFDLIKNYILMSINPENDIEEFYNKYWKNFELDLFWKKDMTTRFDKDIVIDNKTIFLNYWLDANTYENSLDGTKTITSAITQNTNTDSRLASNDGIFWAYRKYLQDKDSNFIEKFSIKLSRDSQFYLEAEKAILAGDIHVMNYDAEIYPALSALSRKYDVPLLLSFISRCIQGLQCRSLWKIVLWLVGQEEQEVSSKQFSQVINVLDSWMTRRYLMPDATHSVNNIGLATGKIVNFLKTQKTLALSKNQEFYPAVKLVEFLTGAKNLELLSWPTDEELRRKVLIRNFSSNLDKTAVIVQAVEEKKRGFDNFSTVHGENNVERRKEKLQLEYILPKKMKDKTWEENPKDLTEDEKIERQKYIYRIGNFILVPTGRSKNIPLDWSRRKEALKSISGKKDNNEMEIVTNAVVLSEKNWDYEAIERQTKNFIEEAIQLWPKPEISDISKRLS